MLRLIFRYKEVEEVRLQSDLISFFNLRSIITMTENQNNSSSKNVENIHVPHDQQEQTQPDSNPNNEILIEDRTQFRKDGI